MLGKIKRQCIYRALHDKLAEQKSVVFQNFWAARVAGDPYDHLVEHIAHIERKMVRIESKMWWVTRKML